MVNMNLIDNTDKMLDKCRSLCPEFIPRRLCGGGVVAEVLQAHVGHLLVGRGVEEDVERHELVGAALEPDAAGHPVLLAAVAGGPQVEVVADHAVRDADVGAGGAELLCPAVELEKGPSKGS